MPRSRRHRRLGSQFMLIHFTKLVCGGQGQGQAQAQQQGVAAARLPCLPACLGIRIETVGAWGGVSAIKS